VQSGDNSPQSKAPAVLRQGTGKSPSKLHMTFMVKELNPRLTDYLLAVNAQMPKPNPDYDPQPMQTTAGSEVPAHAFDLILGRPTATGVPAECLRSAGSAW